MDDETVRELIEACASVLAALKAEGLAVEFIHARQGNETNAWRIGDDGERTLIAALDTPPAPAAARLLSELLADLPEDMRAGISGFLAGGGRVAVEVTPDAITVNLVHGSGERERLARLPLVASPGELLQ